MNIQNWVKLPTKWILQKELQKFKWVPGQGSNNIAALMLLIAIAHHTKDDGLVARLTYNQLCSITELSRAKVSGGLTVLESFNIVGRAHNSRSNFIIVADQNFKWGKLPAKKLYNSGYIAPFREFFLRKPVELNALKLYLLFVALRNNDTNLAQIGYDKITIYSGLERNHIKSGISLLAALSLVHVEHLPSQESEFGVSNAYRLAHLDPYNHMGTRGRRVISEDIPLS